MEFDLLNIDKWQKMDTKDTKAVPLRMGDLITPFQRG